MEFSELVGKNTKFENLRILCDENGITFVNQQDSTSGRIACRFSKGLTEVRLYLDSTQFFYNTSVTECQLIDVVKTIFRVVPVPQPGNLVNPTHVAKRTRGK